MFIEKMMICEEEFIHCLDSFSTSFGIYANKSTRFAVYMDISTADNDLTLCGLLSIEIFNE
jgi:hypothetical protein